MFLWLGGCLVKEGADNIDLNTETIAGKTPIIKWHGKFFNQLCEPMILLLNWLR